MLRNVLTLVAFFALAARGADSRPAAPRARAYAVMATCAEELVKAQDVCEAE